MNDEILKLLYDIRQAILFLEKHGPPTDFKQFEADEMLRSACERKLEIIGEAFVRLRKFAPDLPVSDKEKIISLRNIIIHAYDMVDAAIVWEIIKVHIPVLRTEVEKLINSNSPESL
jgi:uncharacterized protein with HEPN domain